MSKSLRLLVVVLGMLATAMAVQASPRKVHIVVLGAAKRVPYTKTGDPAGAASGEDTLKIRALLVDICVERMDDGRCTRRNGPHLCRTPRDSHQRLASR